MDRAPIKRACGAVADFLDDVLGDCILCGREEGVTPVISMAFSPLGGVGAVSGAGATVADLVSLLPIGESGSMGSGTSVSESPSH